MRRRGHTSSTFFACPMSRTSVSALFRTKAVCRRGSRLPCLETSSQLLSTSSREKMRVNWRHTIAWNLEKNRKTCKSSKNSRQLLNNHMWTRRLESSSCSSNSIKQTKALSQIHTVRLRTSSSLWVRSYAENPPWAVTLMPTTVRWATHHQLTTQPCSVILLLTWMLITRSGQNMTSLSLLKKSSTHLVKTIWGRPIRSKSTYSAALESKNFPLTSNWFLVKEQAEASQEHRGQTGVN